jgi:hypothetical protein
MNAVKEGIGRAARRLLGEQAMGHDDAVVTSRD